MRNLGITECDAIINDEAINEIVSCVTACGNGNALGTKYWDEIEMNGIVSMKINGVVLNVISKTDYNSYLNKKQ
jgi:hypothetical protein